MSQFDMMLMMVENLNFYETSIGFLRSLLKNDRLHYEIEENPKMRNQFADQIKVTHDIFQRYYTDNYQMNAEAYKLKEEHEDIKVTMNERQLKSQGDERVKDVP